MGADGGVFAFGDAGFYGSAGGSGLPWISSPTTTTASAAPVLLAGNGVAGVRFGQSQASAVNGLEQVLGSPVKGPTDMAGNCNVDTAEQWSTLTAYFDKGAFVGYGTWAANGEAVPRGNFETAVGLRVGDTITQADQLYGSAFQTSPCPRWQLVGSDTRGQPHRLPQRRTEPVWTSPHNLQHRRWLCGLSGGDTVRTGTYTDRPVRAVIERAQVAPYIGYAARAGGCMCLHVLTCCRAPRGAHGHASLSHHSVGEVGYSRGGNDILDG